MGICFSHRKVTAGMTSGDTCPSCFVNKPLIGTQHTVTSYQDVFFQTGVVLWLTGDDGGLERGDLECTITATQPSLFRGWWLEHLGKIKSLVGWLTHNTTINGTVHTTEGKTSFTGSDHNSGSWSPPLGKHPVSKTPMPSEFSQAQQLPMCHYLLFWSTHNPNNTCLYAWHVFKWKKLRVQLSKKEKHPIWPSDSSALSSPYSSIL